MIANSGGYALKTVANNYVKYRPMWPSRLPDVIASYIRKQPGGSDRLGKALDVGCGTGQSTLALCQHFRSVVGADTSEAQLEEAAKLCADNKNVAFKLVAAEKLTSVFERESFDLVAAGQALHWFDLKEFYTESFRMLKPRGTLAVFVWQVPSWKNERVNDIILHQIFRRIFLPCWHQRDSHVFNGYKKLFSAMKSYFDDTTTDDSLEIKYHFSLKEVLGFLRSFPQYYYYKEDCPDHPDEIDIALKELMKIYGAASEDDKIFEGSSDVRLTMGRKPLNVS